MPDDRFNALARDPRYRLPSRKEARTAVDPRFGRLFTDQDFRKKASVDRYGRKVEPESGRKELEKLYRLDKKGKKPAGKESGVEREVVGSSEEEDESAEDDGEEEEDEELVGKRDPARDGFSASESEEEESEEEESDVEAELAEETAGQEQTEDIPMGEVTRRIAAVNLDWDNIRASDILAVASSFIPGNGRIDNVTVYPSEYGRERLEREELEGPPREIFASSKRAATSGSDSEEEDDEDEEGSEDEAEDEKIKRQLLKSQASEGTEFDTAALRQYQLERLRYYYAVIECDSKPSAKALYDSMDGREYLSTANFFDLRFIPDDTSFSDDVPRDECTKLPESYKPNEFRTEALTHSKVRLTWDDDDTTRKEVQKRAFSRAEIDENDLQAYIGSDESDADSISSRKSAAEDRKAKKLETRKVNMRAALGLADATVDKGSKGKKGKGEPVGDMQITFTSGLTGSADKAEDKKSGVFENEPQDAESTRDRYVRKERERKQQRKEKRKAGRAGADDNDTPEPTAAGDLPEEIPAEEVDAGFDDPFFHDPASAATAEKKAKKAARQQKRDAQALKDEETATRRKELELLMAGDNERDGKSGGDGVRHFDMREIEKAEKLAKRQGKKGKNGGKIDKQRDGEGEVEGGGGEGFVVDTEDTRFRGVFESHEYALDPTHPRYKGTVGMKALLEEGRRKRKRGGDDDEAVAARPVKQKGKAAAAGDEELTGLVARVKGKSKVAK